MNSTRLLIGLVITLGACGPGEPAQPGDDTGTSTGTGTTDTGDAPTQGTGASTGDTPTTGDMATTGDEAGTTSPDEPEEPEEPPPPVECAVVPGEHGQATCQGGACPIDLDVELRCNDYNFAAPGLFVAAAPETLWVSTSSEHSTTLHRITAGNVAERIAMPASFTRTSMRLATGPQGDLHVAGNSSNTLSYLAETGGFVEQVVRNVGSPITGFQVTPDGTPHIFTYGDDSDDHLEATPDGQGGWQFASVGLPSGYGYARFGRDGLGRVLAADVNEVQGLYRLAVEVDGAKILLGKSLNSLDAAQHFVLAGDASPAPPVGPPFAAMTEHNGGLEVSWPLDGTKSDAMKIPGSTPLERTCIDSTWPDQGEPCGPPCHEQGQGYEHATGSFARSPDGAGWAVVVTTELDFTYVYEEDCSEGDDFGCYCPGTITEDVSTSVLHVFRVTLDDTPPVEVLTMPVSRLELAGAFSFFDESLIGTHVHAFADKLAIGLRLRGADPGEVVVRALRVDLAALAP